MAKGSTKKQSTWDRCVAELQARRCRFRFWRNRTSQVIWIAEYEGGLRRRRFSSGSYRLDSDRDIEDCFRACLAAHESGDWGQTLGGSVADEKLTWEQFAGRVLEDLRARVTRIGSRKNAEGHLREIAEFSGAVSTLRLERWCQERDPVSSPSAFRNRLETLSHIQKAKRRHGLDLTESMARLKALRPTGAAKKEQELRSEEIKAIPTDEALQQYLDDLEGCSQWALAIIATYGLRPSEAWHVEGIDDDGWITIPGDGKTKTKRHIAPPVPSAWLERYQLRENLERYQRELNERWKIKWIERDGVRIPSNNSEVSNSLWRALYRGQIPRLEVDGAWVRPYDLRHSYAIRCFTNPEVFGQSNEDFARWMGHGLEVHERVYLRFMPSTREDDALKAKFAANKMDPPPPNPQQKSPAPVAELPEDVLKKLEKLAKLEQLLQT